MQLQESWMPEVQNKEKAVLVVEGLDGKRSLSSVRSALSLIRGVEAVDVSLESGCATVSYDPERAHASQFPIAVQAVGFRAALRDTQ